MSSINQNGIVSKDEVQALKELIFNRAKERTEQITAKANETYTTNIKFDIMDIARNSVSINDNPFACLDLGTNKTTDNNVSFQADKIICEQPVDTAQAKEATVAKNIIPSYNNLGFRQTISESVKEQLYNKTKTINNNITLNIQNETRENARQEFSKPVGFMGVLNFLNSQASTSLLKKKGKSFDVTI